MEMFSLWLDSDLLGGTAFVNKDCKPASLLGAELDGPHTSKRTSKGAVCHLDPE